jgi:hypothetical protein
MPSHGRHTGRDIRHGTRKPRAGASTPRDQHEVAIKAFALGKYDVTSEQFLTFLKETGYQPRPCSTILDMKWKSPGHGQAYSPLNEEPPHWPAVCLDWHDAEKYLAWLNSHCPPHSRSFQGCLSSADGSRVEYAPRAGTTTARSWGNDIGAGKVNCNGCGSKWDNRLFADVDSFAPNAFGLYGCSAIPGSGPPIAGTKIIWARRATGAHGPRRIATSTSRRIVEQSSEFCTLCCPQRQRAQQRRVRLFEPHRLPRCARPPVIIAMRLSD